MVGADILQELVAAQVIALPDIDRPVRHEITGQIADERINKACPGRRRPVPRQGTLIHERAQDLPQTDILAVILDAAVADEIDEWLVEVSAEHTVADVQFTDEYVPERLRIIRGSVPGVAVVAVDHDDVIGLQMIGAVQQAYVNAALQYEEQFEILVHMHVAAGAAQKFYRVVFHPETVSFALQILSAREMIQPMREPGTRERFRGHMWLLIASSSSWSRPKSRTALSAAISAWR